MYPFCFPQSSRMDQHINIKAIYSFFSLSQLPFVCVGNLRVFPFVVVVVVAVSGEVVATPKRVAWCHLQNLIKGYHGETRPKKQLAETQRCGPLIKTSLPDHCPDELHGKLISFAFKTIFVNHWDNVSPFVICRHLTTKTSAINPSHMWQSVFVETFFPCPDF